MRWQAGGWSLTRAFRRALALGGLALVWGCAAASGPGADDGEPPSARDPAALTSDPAGATAGSAVADAGDGATPAAPSLAAYASPAASASRDPSASRAGAAAAAAIQAVASDAPFGHPGEPGPPDAARVPLGGFTVRGRWDEPRLSWRWEPAGGPFSLAVLERATGAAAQAWNASGVVRLVAAAEGQPADVVLSWHDAGDWPGCKPFGADNSVAHTGAMRLPMAVHLDASRPWSQVQDDTGEWLTGTLLHEFGHVLGLGHGLDPDSLMFADTHARAPTASDLAGIHSLYGGGSACVGDLEVWPAPGADSDAGAEAPLLTLRGVAPPGTSWRPFDVDGDGCDELLVWSTEVLGLGALMVHHFEADPGAERPRLARTSGPLFGALPPDARQRLFIDPDGGRWLLAGFPDGTWRVLAVGRDELLSHPTAAEARTVREAALRTEGPALSRQADLDGDGRVERLEGGGPHAPQSGPGDQSPPPAVR